MNKICSKCNTEKSLDDFHKCSKRLDGCQVYCKVCRKNIDSERYLNNKEKISRSNKKWKKDNSEKVRESSKRTYQRRGDKWKPTRRKWNQDNLEKNKEYKEKWRVTNRNWMYEYNKRYKENNIEKVRESKRKSQTLRNARKKNLIVGEISLTKWERLKLQNGRCSICKRTEEQIESRVDGRTKWEEDHIIPISRNGEHSDNNLQILCWKCNAQKGSKMPR